MLKKSLRKFINKVNPIQKREIRGIKKEVNPDQSHLLDIEKKKKRNRSRSRSKKTRRETSEEIVIKYITSLIF
jgi:hypothetical protein